MKVGILGDIHANLPALEATLKTLESLGCTSFVSVGDIVGYGPFPKECLELLLNRGIPCVKGNHDEYVSQVEDTWSINPEARFAVNWTREQLSPEHRRILADLPEELDCVDFSVVHASCTPQPRWSYILDERSAASSLRYQRRDICFHGHTHLPCVFEELPLSAETQRMLEESSSSHLELLDKLGLTAPMPRLSLIRDGMILSHGRRWLVNAGSIGQPRDKDPRSVALAYDTSSRELRILRVPYDIKLVQAPMIAANFPERLIQRLEVGR